MTKAGKPGKPLSLEHRKKIATALAGRTKRPLSPETRKKLSAALAGRTFSTEHRKNMSEGQKQRWKKT
jgi:hypothetical protein